MLNINHKKILIIFIVIGISLLPTVSLRAQDSVEDVPTALPVIPSAPDQSIPFAVPALPIDGEIPVAPALPIEMQEGEIPVATVVTEEDLLPPSNGYDGRPIDHTLPIEVKILAPAPKEILPTRDVDIFIDISNYKLAEGGNRIHLIHNNKSPISIDDITSPVTLKNLPEGGHTIRVFAVKPSGHSFARPKAFKVVHFYVVKKDFQNYINASGPYITINLPNSGVMDSDELGRVPFDYRLHNALFDPLRGHKLKFSVAGFEGWIDKPGPIYWSNLPNGKHKLKVQLYDATNKPVPGVFNLVERSFEVRKVLKAVPMIKEPENAPMFVEPEEQTVIQ